MFTYCYMPEIPERSDETRVWRLVSQLDAQNCGVLMAQNLDGVPVRPYGTSDIATDYAPGLTFNFSSTTSQCIGVMVTDWFVETRNAPSTENTRREREVLRIIFGDEMADLMGVMPTPNVLEDRDMALPPTRIPRVLEIIGDIVAFRQLFSEDETVGLDQTMSNTEIQSMLNEEARLVELLATMTTIDGLIKPLSDEERNTITGWDVSRIRL